MADDLFELLHGLGAGEPPRVYGCARAAAHRLHRVHVPRVADGVFVLDAPALGLSLTVVFVFFTCLVAAARRRRFAKRVSGFAEAPRSTP